jgi:DNA processing protein
MVRLNLTPDVGPITFARLMERFGEPEQILKANLFELMSVERVGETVAARILAGVSEQQVDEELAAAEKHHARIVSFGDEDYPKNLRNIPDPPLVLYVRGGLKPEDALAIGMVGTRQASFYGKKQARRIAAGLAGCGFTVVSGMARGIDTECHEGALEAGGRTIAVLGTGLGVIYPPENADLYMRIAEKGAVVSEFPMARQAAEGTFPRRNRIISGLSLGVVVVEAGTKSGALITARHAGEQNREVFAVPGMVDSPGSAGCHALIRDGAHLVGGPADVIEALGPLPESVKTEGLGEVSRPQALTLNDRERLVYSQLDDAGATPDELADRTGLSISELNGTLTVLEMRRLVRRLPGPRFVKA